LVQAPANYLRCGVNKSKQQGTQQHNDSPVSQCSLVDQLPFLARVKVAAKIENKKITLSKKWKDGVYIYKKMAPVFWAISTIIAIILAGHANTPVYTCQIYL